MPTSARQHATQGPQYTPSLAHQQQPRLSVASLAIGQPPRVESGWHWIRVRNFGVREVLQISHQGQLGSRLEARGIGLRGLSLLEVQIMVKRKVRS